MGKLTELVEETLNESKGELTDTYWKERHRVGGSVIYVTDYIKWKDEYRVVRSENYFRDEEDEKKYQLVQGVDIEHYWEEANKNEWTKRLNKRKKK